jgi:hypothetical protein
MDFQPEWKFAIPWFMGVRFPPHPMAVRRPSAQALSIVLQDPCAFRTWSRVVCLPN